MSTDEGKKKGGAARHAPTREARAQVACLVAMGHTQLEIAAYIGVSRPTLTNYYDYELRFGRMAANATVGATLYKKATGNGNWREADTACAIWWSKTQMGWRESIKVTDPNGDPLFTGAVESIARKLAGIAARGRTIENASGLEPAGIGGDSIQLEVLGAAEPAEAEG